MNYEDEEQPRAQKVTKQLLESLRAGLGLPSPANDLSVPAPAAAPAFVSDSAVFPPCPSPFPNSIPTFPAMNELLIEQIKKQGIKSKIVLADRPQPSNPCQLRREAKVGTICSQQPSKLEQDRHRAQIFKTQEQIASPQMGVYKHSWEGRECMKKQPQHLIHLPAQIQSSSRLEQNRCRVCGGIQRGVVCHRCSRGKQNQGEHYKPKLNYQPQKGARQQRIHHYQRVTRAEEGKPGRYNYTRELRTSPVPEPYYKGPYGMRSKRELVQSMSRSRLAKSRISEKILRY